MKDKINLLKNQISTLNDYKIYGQVSSIRGLIIECKGLENFLSIGDHCLIYNNSNNNKINAEVISVNNNKTFLLPFENVTGLGIGALIEYKTKRNVIYPDLSWQGRILNGIGEPIDHKGPLIKGEHRMELFASPPNPHLRERVGKRVDLGVKALNCFTTCCIGQRLGVFAGSGVGKSTLLSMLANYADTDIKVIGLIGERGRELREFIEESLGEEGIKKSIIIASTGDESPLMRRHAAYTTITIAEYFARQGKQVLCMIDSVTRFAMALREIGLAIGEAPTAKGYTPSVFAELPKLLERAGPQLKSEGNITAIFSVLVDGDDHNEPIADAVRGILDGHIVLDRKIAERGRFPAVNILKSISRTMPACNTKEETRIINLAKKFISLYENMEDLINIGAYKNGSNDEVDKAIYYVKLLEKFLEQYPGEVLNLEESFQKLKEILQAELI